MSKFKPNTKQSTLFSLKRLWVYGVLIYHPVKKTWMLAKAPGQTFQLTREDAIKYAINNTAGKLRGVLTEKNIIFCVDMTDQAKKVGMLHENSKFDDFIRPHFPNWNGVITNKFGGSSQELLEFDASEIDEDEIKKQLLETITRLSNQELIKPSVIYTARPYLRPLLSDDFMSDKGLIGGCPGSGKETSTLTTIIHFHDRWWGTKFNETKLHVAVATVPSTTMELIKELSSVRGMVNELNFYDYFRIKPYMVRDYEKSYYPILNTEQRVWFRQNVTVVDDVLDIPTYHPKEVVPVLFGSFHDIGMANKHDKITKLKPKYRGLESRIGILSIGEAHKFLSRSDNKMWSHINSLKREFLILITGTPYDYIFNEEEQLYFKPEERVLFTWLDLIREKYKNPNGPFGKYPDTNYYGLPNLKDVIDELKRNVKWESDMNLLTYRKLFTTFDDNGEFTYKDGILFLFKRLFGRNVDTFSNQEEGLSINAAPKLCDLAKRHIIIALPSGQNGHGVGEYVPKLKKILEDSGILSEYKLIEVYEDGDVGDINKLVDSNESKTITLTCTKYLTGTNIPAWGSVVFLKPIGDSVKLFEQIIGRVKRPFDGKSNCGIFIGNIDEVMNIEVSIAEKISMMNGESTSFKEIAISVLDCYNIFVGKNGKWEEIDFPDMPSILEELSVKGNYGVSGCIRELKTPYGFDDMFKTIKRGKEKIDIVDNGGTKAKDINKRTLAKQLRLFTEELNKQKDKDTWYRNMVKKHLAKVRLLCYTNEINTLQEAVSVIENAVQNPRNTENKLILDQIGKGVQWIPHYMLDGTQVDISYINRWIHKINSDNLSLDGVIELLASKELQEEDTAYYPTPLRLFDEMIEKFIEINRIENPMVLDPVGGRGTSLISFIRTYERMGMELDTSNIYYCDINPIWVKIFKKLNNEYSLGIPDENIFCGDVLNPSNKLKKLLDMKEFDVIIGNPPYKNGLHIDIFNTAFDYLKPNGDIIYVQPSTPFINRKPTNENSKTKQIKEIILDYKTKLTLIDGNEIFNAGFFTPLSITHVTKTKDKNIEVIYSHIDDTNVEIKTYNTLDDIFIHGNDIVIRIKDKIFSKMNTTLENYNARNSDYKKYKFYVHLPSISGHIPNHGKLNPDFFQLLYKDDENKFDDVFGDFFERGYNYIGVSNKTEGRNLFEYVKTKFARFCVSLYKINGNLHRGELNSVPYLDFSQKWTDGKLYEHFNLTVEETEFIETYIQNWYERDFR